MHVEQEITINAPPAKVFDALTHDMGAWWGAPYLMGEHARDIVVEPMPGGRVFEDWGGREGALFATVTCIRRPLHLELVGRIGMGGAVTGVVTFDLEARGDGTVLRLSHRAVGEITEQQQANYGMGWQDLLGRRLKSFVESGERLGVRGA
jgi:uncharacterized protein YndB with AHSA1/START domain